MTIENEMLSVVSVVENQSICRTVKGARFIGQASGWYYNPFTRQYGLVLTAFDYAFEGTTHVYPATQLEIVRP